MGQYYKPMSLTKKEYLCSFDYQNGLKLMEHSYIGNNFVREVMNLLTNQWNGDVVLWAGDYADDSDNEYFSDDLIKLTPLSPKELDDELIKNFVFVNYDRDIYCRVDCCTKNEDGWQINPIPLLIVNSNGRGGGDYRLVNKHVGSWAYDRVGLIHKNNIPTNFTEDIHIDFLMDF